MKEEVFNLGVSAMSHLLYSVAIPDVKPRVKQYHKNKYNEIKRSIAKIVGATYNEIDRCFKDASITAPFRSMWFNLKEFVND